ncbi:helix-turn-helix domain-containing protein [Actinomycetospora straminea]|uniref:HTH merR-type domain-containing protein n=1 Tax=Actinomycetospora straminea TaxID=663607 RepID=A0ABP9EGC1_9PSEU|nr:helix-turn-helix domain-containing protein [Actinomycetospora straminea]MDD7936382.1 helix-turn-helix domain-containing protein [Actinomycetospora straminea]
MGPDRAEHERKDATEAVGADSLDEEDPPLTTGQAAEFLGVRPAFLRSLDAGRMVRPERSAGGHRRWTRRQLALASRIRELFDEGLTLTAAAMVVSLQDEVALVTRERDQAHDELDRARRELARARRELAAARGEHTARSVPAARPSARVHRACGPEVPTTALRPPLPAPPPQRTSST